MSKKKVNLSRLFEPYDAGRAPTPAVKPMLDAIARAAKKRGR